MERRLSFYGQRRRSSGGPALHWAALFGRSPRTTFALDDIAECITALYLVLLLSNTDNIRDFGKDRLGKPQEWHNPTVIRFYAPPGRIHRARAQPQCLTLLMPERTLGEDAGKWETACILESVQRDRCLEPSKKPIPAPLALLPSPSASRSGFHANQGQRFRRQLDQIKEDGNQGRLRRPPSAAFPLLNYNATPKLKSPSSEGWKERLIRSTSLDNG
ncbi:hypothetical protein BKA70DRAFT_1223566 [Coprinopsis sp. MPI-PUGE-AT-0042]|nr:hypothetical protein BKA70DRAFT_1223566 [Coprinopsis sp. MPI-PUGE-AT-0042]